ncbi:baseplate wedge subunit [Synechococcus phage DSL-LC02]|nr:baseplate wedge subunit [Synechococcus phage DSL-LC02]
MPVARQDKKFVDISLSFKRNPISNDILLIKNEDAVKRSIRNLIFTNNGDRFFNPLIGSSIRNALFNLADTTLDIGIEQTVKLVLENFEPRIKVKSVTSVLSPDTNECNVEIVYDLLGSEVVPQNLSFVLQSTKA